MWPYDAPLGLSYTVQRCGKLRHTNTNQMTPTLPVSLYTCVIFQAILELVSALQLVQGERGTGHGSGLSELA